MAAPPVEMLAVLRWTSRVAGVVVALAYLGLVLGELVSPHSNAPPGPLEWIGIVLLSTACLAIVVAWRWPVAGAIASLPVLVAFVLIIRLRQPFIIATIAIPGVLYLLDWVANRFHRLHGA